MKPLNPQAKWLSDFVYAQLSGCCIEQKYVAQSRPIDVKVKKVTWRAPVKDELYRRFIHEEWPKRNIY